MPAGRPARSTVTWRPNERSLARESFNAIIARTGRLDASEAMVRETNLGRQAQRGPDWVPSGLLTRRGANCATSWDGPPHVVQEPDIAGGRAQVLEEALGAAQPAASEDMQRARSAPHSGRWPRRQTPFGGRTDGNAPRPSPTPCLPDDGSDAASQRAREDCSELVAEEAPRNSKRQIDFLTPVRPNTCLGIPRPSSNGTPRQTFAWRPNEASLARRHLNDILECPHQRRRHDASATMIRDVNMGRQSEWGPQWTPPGLLDRAKSFNASRTWAEQPPNPTGSLSARGPRRPFSQSRVRT